MNLKTKKLKIETVEQLDNVMKQLSYDKHSHYWKSAPGYVVPEQIKANWQGQDVTAQYITHTYSKGYEGIALHVKLWFQGLTDELVKNVLSPDEMVDANGTTKGYRLDQLTLICDRDGKLKKPLNWLIDETVEIKL